MDREKMVKWMRKWAVKHGAVLELEGHCGFGRECVGILANGLYPDYYWEEEGSRGGGHVWVPPDAYHKHECVAVLGCGEQAEEQLYQWLKWFNKNNFTIEVAGRGEEYLLSSSRTDIYSRMVRK